MGTGAAGRPPGTNSAAVGLSCPLLRADFREGACRDIDMLRLELTTLSIECMAAAKPWPPVAVKKYSSSSVELNAVAPAETFHRMQNRNVSADLLFVYISWLPGVPALAAWPSVKGQSMPS